MTYINLFSIFTNLKRKKMFDIKDPNKFLGGQNVHNLLIIGMLGFLVYKSIKK